MKNEKSIIKRVKAPNPFINSHIAEITGAKAVSAPRYFENLITGERYDYIAGGLGLPGKEKSGCALIIGVDRMEDDSEPVFRALDMVEDRNLTALLWECARLRIKYGYEEDPDLFQNWTADGERAASIFNRFNADLLKEDDKAYGIYSYPPVVQWGQPHACECYLRNVFDMLSMRRLKLGACPALKNYIQTLPPEGVGETLPDIYPALAALAFTVTNLLEIRPWEHAIVSESSMPTIEDELFGVMNDDGFGDLDEYDDDGGLINTVGEA